MLKIKLRLMEQKMTNQIERPIGEKFVDPSIGAIVEVCLGGNCLDCVYCKTKQGVMPEYECMKGKEVGYCHKRCRSDKKDVHFEIVEMFEIGGEQ